MESPKPQDVLRQMANEFENETSGPAKWGAGTATRRGWELGIRAAILALRERAQRYERAEYDI